MLEGELAVEDASGQPIRHLRDRVLAINVDEVGERGKQGGIGKHLRLDAVMQRIFPSIEDVSERRLLMRRAFRASQHVPCPAQFLCPLSLAEGVKVNITHSHNRRADIGN